MTRRRKYCFPKNPPATCCRHCYLVQITISLSGALRSRKGKHKAFLQSDQRKKGSKQSCWCSQLTLRTLLWMVLQASRAVWKPTDLGSPWVLLSSLALRDFKTHDTGELQPHWFHAQGALLKIWLYDILSQFNSIGSVLP